MRVLFSMIFNFIATFGQAWNQNKEKMNESEYQWMIDFFFNDCW